MAANLGGEMFLHKIWNYTFFIGMNTILVFSASAQDSKIEAQAIRCSTIYFAISGAADIDKNSATIFEAIASNFMQVYANEKNAKNTVVSLADIQARRDLIIKEFTENYVSRQDALQEEAVLCGAWFEGFRVQGENYAYVPIIPKIIPNKVREEYAALAATGFKNWVSSGYALPVR